MYEEAINKEFPSSSTISRGYINDCSAEFEQLLVQDAQFNRLLMYRGSSLHSGCIGHDYTYVPDPATGRLTLTSFIHAER